MDKDFKNALCRQFVREFKYIVKSHQNGRTDEDLKGIGRESLHLFCEMFDNNDYSESNLHSYK